MNKRTQWIAVAVLALSIGAVETAQACGCHRHVVRTSSYRTTQLAPVGEYTVIRERPIVVSRTWYNEGLAPVGERVITTRPMMVSSNQCMLAPVGEREVIVRRTLWPEPSRTIVYRTRIIREQPAPVGERIVTRRTVITRSGETLSPVAEREQPGFFESVGNVVSAPFRWVGGAFGENEPEPVGEQTIVTTESHTYHHHHHYKHVHHHRVTTVEQRTTY